jgi:hypothetical protein
VYRSTYTRTMRAGGGVVKAKLGETYKPRCRFSSISIVAAFQAKFIFRWVCLSLR